MEIVMRFARLLAVLAALPPASAVAGDAAGRHPAVFLGSVSSAELAAVEKYGAEFFRRAKAAGRPVLPRVAIAGGTTMISLESVALCDRVSGCPLLVFRDIAKKPVLTTSAFQNITLDYREAGTWLILRDNAGPERECKVSVPGKATCRPARQATTAVSVPRVAPGAEGR